MNKKISKVYQYGTYRIEVWKINDNYTGIIYKEYKDMTRSEVYSTEHFLETELLERCQAWCLRDVKQRYIQQEEKKENLAKNYLHNWLKRD